MLSLSKLVAVILFVSLLSGCDSLHRDQLRIRPNFEDVNLELQQNALVVQALAAVANVHGFADSLHYARIDGVLAYFTEDSEDFPIAFGARRVGGDVIVDIRHFVPGLQESPKYMAVRSAIIDELNRRFGTGAIAVLEREQHVP